MKKITFVNKAENDIDKWVRSYMLYGHELLIFVPIVTLSVLDNTY